MTTSHLFGGGWTDEKLERVRKYLVAYATIMSHYKFRYAYIDAFAGTGYRSVPKAKERLDISILDLEDADSQDFIDGSARIALQVKPRFNKYIFIEHDPKRYEELGKLKTDFPALAGDIILVNSDANTYIKNMCLRGDWRYKRAVLFLDPYGMQVTWDTIDAIAKTQAIDLWILFPLGIGVNRLLKRSGKITDSWRQKLDMMFGTTDWYDAFYQPTAQPPLFGDDVSLVKVGDFDAISQYFVKRLKTIFAGVADNPLPLLNSRNNPLYLLCFASGNPKGATTAIKIAQDILGR